MKRKSLFVTGLLASSLVATAGGIGAAQDADAKRIAFFVSDLSNVFHQAQGVEAQRYAAEKYGAEVVVFDGQADSAVMTQNIDAGPRRRFRRSDAAHLGCRGSNTGCHGRPRGRHHHDVLLQPHR